MFPQNPTFELSNTLNIKKHGLSRLPNFHTFNISLQSNTGVCFLMSGVWRWLPGAWRLTSGAKRLAPKWGKWGQLEISANPCNDFWFPSRSQEGPCPKATSRRPKTGSRAIEDPMPACLARQLLVFLFSLFAQTCRRNAPISSFLLIINENPPGPQKTQNH